MIVVKKNIYLHIGLHKTGTTTIQSSLFHHRSMWEEKGYCVPSIAETYPYHHGLVEHWAHFGEKYRCGMTPDDSWDNVIDSINSSELSNAIISSEEFTNYTVNESALEFIANKLEKYSIKIILFLRRQDDFVESAFKEIRKHRNISSFRVYWEEYQENPSVHLNYNYLVDMWRDVFGVKNVCLFDYQKLQLNNLELLAVFENFCGARVSEKVRSKNVSEGNIRQGIRDEFNLDVSQCDSEGFERMESVIKSHISIHNLRITLIPYEIRSQIESQYIANNDNLNFDSTEFFKGENKVKNITVEELLQVRPLRNALLKTLL